LPPKRLLDSARPGTIGIVKRISCWGWSAWHSATACETNNAHG